MNRWDAHVAILRSTVERHEAGAPAANVSRRARLLLLDTVGCALAGRRIWEVRSLESNLAGLERGGFSFPGGKPLGLRAATQILAIAATWDEAGEGHAHAHGRPGIPLVAALVPLVLERNQTVGAFIGALVLGYEIGARAGGWLRVPRGIHVDGNWPAIGVAAGVSRLLGSDAMRAMNNAACQLPYSLYLPVRHGLTVRNTYLSHSATLGLDAALATHAGFGAPSDALGHYADHFAAAETQPPPGPARDLILEAYFKPFAAVRHVHYGALAARALRGQLDIQSIRDIDLRIYEEAITYCDNRDPLTPLAAQFSLSFGIATMLRFGELDPASYDEPRFSDPEMRRLEKLVRIAPDRRLSESRQRGARLTIDGLTADTPDAHPDLVLDEAGVVAKFRRNAPAAGRFCDAVLDAPDATPFEKLWGTL